MFNFCEVFAGRAMFTDAGRAYTCKRKFRAPPLQRKIQKMKVFPSWILAKNLLNISDQKLKTFTFGIREQNKKLGDLGG